MNLRLVARLLGMIAWLIGGAMAFSLIWAFPAAGAGQEVFERRGFIALLVSMAVCGGVGAVLRLLGRGSKRAPLFRKEAMAVVGLSWALATVLGGLPYYFGGMVYRAEAGQELPMGVAECLFESQSGFSTTGATVLSKIENPDWAPRCLLFWRSSTHFLGGLGIIVLFVAVLGQGAAGKALMRAEVPGPNKDTTHERMQHTAWVFAGIYVVLNIIMAIVLKLEGAYTVRGQITWFEAICHAFGTMATGGFSTMDSSLGGFESKVVEYTVIVFMVFAGTNFTLIYLFCIGKPGRLFADLESRTYFLIIIGATIAVMVFGVAAGRQDFNPTGTLTSGQEFESALRNSLFHVVSVMTTTGFGADDYDRWSSFSRALLLFLMFVGACAGSTGGGMKVIRHILFVKIISREFELSFHPSVVRHIRIGKETLTDPTLVRSVLTYVGLIAVVFTTSWILFVAIEPDETWVRAGHPVENKLIDSASAVAASLHNIGPGLGIVGPTENYALFTPASKLLLTLLMMLGRLELFAIFVLILPSFWRMN